MLGKSGTFLASASALISFTTKARASGFTPFSQREIKIERVFLLIPQLRSWEISYITEVRCQAYFQEFREPPPVPRRLLEGLEQCCCSFYLLNSMRETQTFVLLGLGSLIKLLLTLFSQKMLKNKPILATRPPIDLWTSLQEY